MNLLYTNYVKNLTYIWVVVSAMTTGEEDIAMPTVSSPHPIKVIRLLLED